MPLSAAAAGLLRSVLAERDPLIERATDKVFYGSTDLAGRRPRIVTRMLVQSVFACSEAALLAGDERPFGLFIDQVTGLRAEKDFHVSTLMLGFRSFRFAIEAPLRATDRDPWLAWEVLAAADDLYVRTASRAADLLVERQGAALRERKSKLERRSATLAEELRLIEQIAAGLRADLDAVTLENARLREEIKEKNAAIEELLEADRPESDVASVGPEPRAGSDVRRSA